MLSFIIHYQPTAVRILKIFLWNMCTSQYCFQKNIFAYTLKIWCFFVRGRPGWLCESRWAWLRLENPQVSAPSGCIMCNVRQLLPSPPQKWLNMFNTQYFNNNISHTKSILFAVVENMWWRTSYEAFCWQQLDCLYVHLVAYEAKLAKRMICELLIDTRSGKDSVGGNSRRRRLVWRIRCQRGHVTFVSPMTNCDVDKRVNSIRICSAEMSGNHSALCVINLSRLNKINSNRLHRCFRTALLPPPF